MRVLAFDTCFSTIDIAVLDGGKIAGHVSETVDGGHGERLLPLVAATLEASGLAFADLDRIAVTLGPGGFTGLRVGVAVARALALSTGKPLVGMSSLELLARTAMAEGHVQPTPASILIATADGRKGALFAQQFITEPWSALTEPELVTADTIASAAPQRIVVGAGAAAVEAASSGRIRAVAADLRPDARVLATIAPLLTPLSEPRPLYVRAADAKPQTGKSLPRA